MINEKKLKKDIKKDIKEFIKLRKIKKQFRLKTLREFVEKYGYTYEEINKFFEQRRI